jgi:hypothetical protein
MSALHAANGYATNVRFVLPEDLVTDRHAHECEADRLARDWHDPSGESVYRVFETLDEADRDVRDAALAGRDFACAHLGVETPLMRFYVAEGEWELAYRKRYGMADWPSFRASERWGHALASSGSIGVRVDLGVDPCFVAGVAAHEVRHLAQKSLGIVGDAIEADATAYEGYALTALIHPTRHVVGTVRRHDGYPVTEGPTATLAGVANQWDVLVATTGDGTKIYRNFQWGQPLWVDHYASCPVPVRG